MASPYMYAKEYRCLSLEQDLNSSRNIASKSRPSNTILLLCILVHSYDRDRECLTILNDKSLIYVRFLLRLLIYSLRSGISPLFLSIVFTVAEVHRLIESTAMFLCRLPRRYRASYCARRPLSHLLSRSTNRRS